MASQATQLRDSCVTPNKTRVLITPREQEVFDLLCEGYTTKEIAYRLYVSPHTIITHKKNLVTKFQARNVVQMVARAIKKEL